MRQGLGILYDNSENEVYTGNWLDNSYHGMGRLLNINAESLNEMYDCRDFSNIGNFWLSYEGEFRDGKMWGKGNLDLTNGEKF